jgi:sulfane dehydrogenase subunit SoxC
MLLGRGVALAGAMGAGGAGTLTGAAAEPLAEGPWGREVGSVIPAYQTPSRFEKNVVRTQDNPDNVPRNSRARTPHQMLQGIITPNGLHFTICHGGVPDIDPAQHRLAIHGLVRRPLEFTLEALERYPKVSRIGFVECGGNSAPLFSNVPLQENVQALHGLASCSEWTGVLVSTLLEEAGVDPKAKWMIAEGADSPHLSRSVPLAKGLDDAMVALYQNGERIQPGQGYPMRLWLPGYEGNMNVKYLRRLMLTEEPAMTMYESRTYAQILPNGKAYRFYFLREVKSFITRQASGLRSQASTRSPASPIRAPGASPR